MVVQAGREAGGLATAVNGRGAMRSLIAPLRLKSLSGYSLKALAKIQ
jgi:hypothetical protein